ncbi:tetratricopeptide repeat protein [Portibacter lacus]|uniref:Tetratricopeptide repeat protein n=1 Tax=Portibacter lacus TaxID=1099794 RepID=A0AA37WC30_9BACT|nr:tetratricopeptide repeat protein [Portibacter lacus]GLR15703.1 hypothetical protein GCM10007940_03180 [Portibacter lacus]
MDSRLKSLLNLLKDSPNDGFLLFAIAKEYEGQEDFENALSYYEKLRSIDQDYVGLYFHLGALYAELDDSDKAMEVYDQGIEIAIKIKDQHALSELKGSKMNLELGL